VADIGACLAFSDQFSPQDDETDHHLKSSTNKYIKQSGKKDFLQHKQHTNITVILTD